METVLKNLKLRRFDAYCVANKEEAKALALSFIKPDDKVGYGGSMTLYQIGILDELRKDGRCHLVDRDLASTPEESLAYNMEAKDADVYLGSANAISETGTIFQTDGRGNRVSTMIFGAKSVILIVGKNKIVPTDEEARQRIRLIAAPLNAKRLNRNTPCVKLGHCIDCLSPESICANRVEMRLCMVPGRIKVILVDEELGY